MRLLDEGGPGAVTLRAVGDDLRFMTGFEAAREDRRIGGRCALDCVRDGGRELEQLGRAEFSDPFKVLEGARLLETIRWGDGSRKGTGPAFAVLRGC